MAMYLGGKSPIGIQHELFQEIRNRIPGNQSFADTIAGVLEIGIDSAYRRIRGEKAITLEEAKKLGDHFQVSLDKVLSQGQSSDQIVFQNQVRAGTDFAGYLDALLEQTLIFKKQGNAMVYFDAKDFAPFQLFHFNFLTRFKMFFWLKAILGYPEFTNMSFEDYQPDELYMRTVHNIALNYCKLPSTEIWSIDTIHTTIRQLEYVKYAGYCKDPKSLITVFDEFEALVNHLKSQAEQGRKFVYGTKPDEEAGLFHLYYNETYLGNNTVLVTSENQQQVFMNYNVLSYLTSGNTEFCRQTKQFIDNAIQKSVLISATGEKDRNRFFRNISIKLSEARSALLA
ncbi:MAG: hypothetical protein WC760_09290 [Bacteroidia bacterium]|jgi:hypothetical protein